MIMDPNTDTVKVSVLRLDASVLRLDASVAACVEATGPE